MKIFTTIICAIFFFQIASAQDSPGSIEGKISDLEAKEPLLFATVAVYKTGSETPFTGVETDLDGNYSISNLDPGVYDIEVSYVGYTKKKVNEIKVIAGEVTRLNIGLKESINDEPIYFGCDFYWYEPLIRHDDTTSGRTITARDIANSPLKW